MKVNAKDYIIIVNELKKTIKSTYKCYSVNDAHFYNSGYIDALRINNIIAYSTMKEMEKYMGECEHEENK
jgi:hypothetical protein